MPDEGDSGYLILCHECGLAAMVPFRPAEGRAVYCPPCHRRLQDEGSLQRRPEPRDLTRPPGTG